LQLTRQGGMSLAGARLVVLKGPDKGRSLRLEREEVVVGTSPSCDLPLADPTVSRHHLLLRALPDAYLVTDLGTTNGTLIGGHRVLQAHVVPGDKIELGETRLKLEASRDDVTLAVSKAESFGRLLGRSVASRRLFALLEQVAAADATVLVQGETGTGKDLVAEAIHEASGRARGPFVVFDCAGVAPSLLESELFGHEKGAFTGAVASRAGALEEAHRGTLYLDEVGGLALDVQPKLLRAIEKREVRRLGGNGVRPVDVRIVASTQRDLRQDVNRGAFREDLYYRLSVVPIRIPPLRERPDDIVVLAEHFRAEVTRDAGGKLPVPLVSALLSHPWPGNVRELRNHIEHLFVLPDAVEGPAGPGASQLSYREAKARALEAFERGFLSELMLGGTGQIADAARRARMDRVFLTKLLRKHGIKG